MSSNTNHVPYPDNFTDNDHAELELQHPAVQSYVRDNLVQLGEAIEHDPGASREMVYGYHMALNDTYRRLGGKDRLFDTKNPKLHQYRVADADVLAEYENKAPF